jgi:ketosteroid isomerase-like protein
MRTPSVLPFGVGEQYGSSSGTLGVAGGDMSRLVLVAFVVAASLTAGIAEQRSSAGKDEVLLTELQQALAKAWVSANRAAIDRIIAPDWRLTGPDGRVTDRAGVLADVFETRRHKIHRVEVDDVTARVFGDAAVVTGRTHGVGEVEGSPYDVVIRFTDTFVRREGRWQAVASHASLVAGRQ